MNVCFGYEHIPINYASELNGAYYINGKDLIFHHEKHALS
jgi:hypothetical protein